MRCLSLVLAVASLKSVLANDNFHPKDYEKTLATCIAVTRNNPYAGGINTRVELSYVNINPEAKSTLLFVHGWPSLWSSWSNQILEFKDTHHLIVPDLRGFGGSSHPSDIRLSGRLSDLVADLVCILKHAKVSNAICIGHDWGSSICYEAARSRPDIFTAVVGAAVPYLPAAGDFVPVQDLVPHFPRLAYQIYFDKNTPVAVEELNKDIRRSLRSVLRTIDSAPPEAFLSSSTEFLGAYPEEIDPAPFFSQEEEDYFVEQFSLQGFDKTLYFYMTENREGHHTFAHEQHNITIYQPVLAIYPSEDRVANWMMIAGLAKSNDYLPNVKTELIRSAHWPQLEAPEEFNKMIRSWLDDAESKASQEEQKEQSSSEGRKLTEEQKVMKDQTTEERRIVDEL